MQATMRDGQRMIWIFVAVLAMTAGGCGDDDSGGSPDAAVTDDGGSAPDGGTQLDGGSTPDAGPVTEQYLELQLSATVITEEDEAGAVTASCLAFDTAVNVTLGLPIVRTSVDHGTALDLAWKGTAQASSLIQAVSLAARLARSSVATNRAGHMF